MFCALLGVDTEPIRPRSLYFHRPGVPRLVLCRAAESHERYRVRQAVRQALGLIGYQLVPARSAGQVTRRRCPRLQIGRVAYYLRRVRTGGDNA